MELKGTLTATGTLTGSIYQPAVVMGVDIVDVDTTTSEEAGGANSVLFTLSNGTTSTLTVYNGPEGPAGATGPQGAQGPKGDTGPKGETGPQGETGPKGETGATGPQGPKGDTGATGAKGDKGDKGDTGAKGDKGDPGTNGTNGTDGRDGADGDDGTTFTPSVSSAGVISWTNDGGKQNPASVDLVAAVISALPSAVGVNF